MKASQATALFGSLKCWLYSERNYLPNSWEKAALSIGLATIVGLLGTASGCMLIDRNSPVVRNYAIAGLPATEPTKWAVEGEDVNVELSTYDNEGTKSAYVQLNNGVKIHLTKVAGIKKGGERAEWKAKRESENLLHEAKKRLEDLIEEATSHEPVN